MKRYYSGKESRAFWDRLNKARMGDTTSCLYLSGCFLQDIEARVLQLLEAAENNLKRRCGTRRRHE